MARTLLTKLERTFLFFIESINKALIAHIHIINEGRKYMPSFWAMRLLILVHLSFTVMKFRDIMVIPAEDDAMVDSTSTLL